MCNVKGVHTELYRVLECPSAHCFGFIARSCSVLQLKSVRFLAAAKKFNKQFVRSLPSTKHRTDTVGN